MTAAIACSDLSFSWPDGASVLSGLTVSFGPGRTGLIGVNGSGKSTLLNILGGLDVPTSGDVVYQDHNLTSANDAQLTEYRRTHVGFVFQFYNLIPSLTARENVTLVTEIVEHPMTAEQALGMVGLDHRLDHFPAQLDSISHDRASFYPAPGFRNNPVCE